jgi:predicted permease
MRDWAKEIRDVIAPLDLPPAREAAVVEELSQHLGDRYDELLMAGVDPEAAYRILMLDLNDEGNLVAGLEATLHTSRQPLPFAKYGHGSFFAGIWNDLRYGARLLLKRPGFAFAAIMALTLGIGAVTAIFSVVYGVILSPLPYRDPDRLVAVWSTNHGNRDAATPADFLDWRRENTVFSDLFALSITRVTVSNGEGTELVGAMYTTPGFARILGMPMLLGREFLPEEGEYGKSHVALLSYELWRDSFGSDPGVLGRQVRIDREPYTVVGVLKPAPTERETDRLFMPLAFRPEQITRDAHMLYAQGRLKVGVTLEQANAEMATIARRTAASYPVTSKDWGARVEPLHNDFLEDSLKTALYLLLGAVGFVLLIACANVANLLLAQATLRQREIAIRGALGASRGQIFRQFLTESLLLAAIGAGLGVALAWGLLKAVIAIIPQDTLPQDQVIGIQIPVLLFTLGITIVSCLLFGSAPAWQAAHMNSSEAMKDGSRSTTRAGGQRMRRALVVGEFALALTLLASGGLAIHSFWNLAHVDLGFRKDHVLTFLLPVPPGQLTQPDTITAFYRPLLEKLGALPGVSAVAAATGIPVYGPGLRVPFTIAGQPTSDPRSRPSSGLSMVTPGYFQSFGIRMDRGRAITEQDRAGTLRVAVVNESFVKQYLSGLDPLAQSVVIEPPAPGATNPGLPVEWQIVGVYADVRNRGMRGEERPEIDVPFWQNPWAQTEIAVRTTGNPESVENSIAAVVRSVDRDLPMAEVMTMDQVVDESMGSDRFEAVLFGGFSGVALLLAALGIYSVMAFSVAQRTHEIGVRMALGADRGRVLRLVLRDGMVQALAGLVLGLTGAWFAGRALQNRLFGIGAVDPVALVSVSAVLLGAALLACFVPAWRATKVDPILALREE